MEDTFSECIYFDVSVLARLIVVETEMVGSSFLISFLRLHESPRVRLTRTYGCINGLTNPGVVRSSCADQDLHGSF